MTTSPVLRRVAERICEIMEPDGEGDWMAYLDAAEAVMDEFESLQRPPTYRAAPGWVFDAKRKVAWQPGGAIMAGALPAMARHPNPSLIETPGEILYRFRGND